VAFDVAEDALEGGLASNVQVHSSSIGSSATSDRAVVAIILEVDV
jgi:hypothetical protein